MTNDSLERERQHEQNKHGCWIFACYGPWKQQEQAYVGTVSGLHDLLMQKAGDDGASDEAGVAAVLEWARTCKPGAVECYHDIHWLIAVDPLEDHSCLLDDPCDADRVEKLGRPDPPR